MKKVRMLLRVSSNQQLEADGDLTIQRQLVEEYINKQNDWVLDDKEYFEGSNSGYKNSVEDRNVLQEALADAKKHEYDILVVYKDDRVGRRMWEIGAYVMQLKNCGVDIYTVKDGCISPETDDIMGQMMLALRYGNAQKSSSDTGMRVKDTAQKLVQKGKFMGGAAPYAYEFVYSGEISKHGRALKKLQIVEEKANVVRHIYNLSYNKEYGSAKIAKTLNLDEYYMSLAPNNVWKAGTITSILTNPVYSGYVAYKRREKINGRFLKLSDEEWIKSEVRDDSIVIIEEDIWNLVQKKRNMRGQKYKGSLEDKDITVIKKSDGILPLIDVLYCGYCGQKMTNATRYHYWTIKSTGEKKAHKIPAYKCQGAWEGVPHEENRQRQYRADEVESIIFPKITEYLSELLKNIDASMEYLEKSENNSIKSKLKRYKQSILKATKSITAMEEHIPDAVLGTYPLSVEQLSNAIQKQKEKLEELNKVYANLEQELENESERKAYSKAIKENIVKWEDRFLNSDSQTKRVIINQIVERIELTRYEVKIIYKLKI